MKLVCAMPVGPGEADRHLEKCLKAAGWADLLLVYGDAPDAETATLIRRYADHCVIGEENLYLQGEHVMRNELWALCDQHCEAADMICCLDADEQFAEPDERVREILSSLEDNPGRSFSARFFHLWTEDGSMHRVDGAWRSPVGPRICRFEPGTRLRPLYETAWVCPPLPPHLNRPSVPILHILHWSYACEQHRAPKVKFYQERLGHDIRHVNSIIETPVLEPVPSCN